MDNNAKLLDFFTRVGKRTTREKEQIIIPLGQDPSHAFYLLRGYVKAYDITKYGQSNLLMIYKHGEIFPLPDVLQSREEAESYVVYEALTDVTLSTVEKNDILNEVRNDPDFAQALVQQLLNIFSIYRLRIQNLGLRTARERIMFRLMLLVERFGIKRNDEIIIDAPITHQLIADATALTRETASREVRKLVKEGYIEQQNHLIVVKDYEKIVNEFE
jgi:CRP-like cAMP-binding protein